MSRGNPTLLVVAALAAAALSGCRQPLMEDQPRHEPLEASDMFADGTSARLPPAGTIPRGALRADDHLYTGRVGGALVTAFPWRLTAGDLARGRERYDIFCAPCHGRLGDGLGMIVQRGFVQPRSFHDPIVRAAPVGRLYEVISHGTGVMRGYPADLRPRDRWRVAGYIRALQLSQRAPLDALSPAEREQLEAPR